MQQMMEEEEASQGTKKKAKKPKFKSKAKNKFLASGKLKIEGDIMKSQLLEKLFSFGKK